MIECYGTSGDGCADGGIAQLARAIGSYPIGRGFKSNFRYHGTGNGPAIRPVGQAAKTPPFHGGNGGSIPPRVRKKHAEACFFQRNKSATRICEIRSAREIRLWRVKCLRA